MNNQKINKKAQRNGTNGEDWESWMKVPAISNKEFFKTTFNSLHRDRRVSRHLCDKQGGCLQSLGGLDISEESQSFC